MNKTHSILPKFLIRPSDYTRFDLMESGKYTHSDRTGWTINEYTYETLHNLGFYPAMANELDEYAKFKDEHYAFLSWQCRSNGHGGSKGGTPDEYKEYLERVKKYKKYLGEPEQNKNKDK